MHKSTTLTYMQLYPFTVTNLFTWRRNFFLQEKKIYTNYWVGDFIMPIRSLQYTYASILQGINKDVEVETYTFIIFL